MTLLAVLGMDATPGSHGPHPAWAQCHTLRFLLPVDVARLVIAVLEGGGADACDRVHSLRVGSAPIALLEISTVLDEAASHACWRALAVLLKDLKACSPSWVVSHAETIVEVEGLQVDGRMQRATEAHRGTHYCFGLGVSKVAAERGHLSAVQWLLPRTAQRSGQVAPRRRVSVDVPAQKQWTDQLLKHAAHARQLHVVEWLVNSSPRYTRVLPYDDELQAVCWLRPDNGRVCFYYCASKKHGFSEKTAVHPVNACGVSEAGISKMPLADGFAGDGDLATLKKIRARPDYKALICPDAIVVAAEHGHLDIVQWLYELFPTTDLLGCTFAAGRGGHLHVVEWLESLSAPSIGSANIDAAGRGHIHILRWYAAHKIERLCHFPTVALSVAIQNGHMEVVRFLHEECGVPMESPAGLDALRTKCANVAVCEYVLTRVDPLHPIHMRQLMAWVAEKSSLEVIKHFVLIRAWWDRRMLDSALRRPEISTNPREKLELCRFLYTHANDRATKLGVRVEDQLDFRRSSHVLFRFANAQVAAYLAKDVPEFTVWGANCLQLDDALAMSANRSAIIHACIRFRTRESHSVSWLPQWAVRVNSLEALELLDVSGHPHVRDLDTYHAIIRHTRDSRLLLRLLPLPVDLAPLLREDVVEWAAKFGMNTVLDRVFDNETTKTQRQLLKHVTRPLGISGHVETCEWFLKRSTSLQIPIAKMLFNVQTEALRCGHVRVLQWLKDCQFLSQSVSSIQLMVCEAADSQQVRSLAWVLSTTSVPTKLILRMLLNAVRSNCMSLALFLSTRYEPTELNAREDDRRLVREYLAKQESPPVVAAATTPPSKRVRTE